MRFHSIVGRIPLRVRVCCLALAITGCVASPGAPPAPPAPAPALPRHAELLPAPPVAREFRGVWVATVGNMDWPSRPGLSTARQKAELIAILDRAKEIGLNAIIFQVRPAADALYDSPFEPWSEYLTGTMGRAPDPYYDPLAFAIEESHRRGMELHAWFNPFRARGPSSRATASADHVTRQHPEWIRRYGTQRWMDPSEPGVQEQSIEVVMDVVHRYDIDGVHIDDYFYPYRENDAKGKLIDFPDGENYARYRAAGGEMGRSDWRRNNVDSFIERLYRQIKAEKPQVKFGISPFGIWRPGHPAQIVGLDSYEEIFADSRKWLRNGWLDYLAPQLYWPIAKREQSFPVLLQWWVGQNPMGRHIWAGDYSGRVGGSRGWPASEIVAQVEATRANRGASGNIHFNMTSLMQSPDGLSERLATEVYAQPAIVPASPWLGAEEPGRPLISVRRHSADGTEVAISPTGPKEAFLWTVRSRTGQAWTTQLLSTTNGSVLIPSTPDQIVVSAIGRTGTESPLAVLSRRTDGPGWVALRPAPTVAAAGIGAYSVGSATGGSPSSAPLTPLHPDP